MVKGFILSLGEVEDGYQWLSLDAEKGNGETFSIRICARSYPAKDASSAADVTKRYIFQQGRGKALEFVDAFTGRPVLPSLGAWPFLLPRTDGTDPLAHGFPAQMSYLGHEYGLVKTEEGSASLDMPKVKLLRLPASVLIGPLHNTRQKDETRRFDGSDYELIRLEETD